MLKAAFGGAIPPILWDGAGDAKALALSVTDPVKVLGMGLAQGAPMETAHPGLVVLDGTPPTAPAPVVLPASMEAAVK